MMQMIYKMYQIFVIDEYDNDDDEIPFFIIFE